MVEKKKTEKIEQQKEADKDTYMEFYVSDARAVVNEVKQRN